jgi:hypothetical protein
MPEGRKRTCPHFQPVDSIVCHVVDQKEILLSLSIKHMCELSQTTEINGWYQLGNRKELIYIIYWKIMEKISQWSKHHTLVILWGPCFQISARRPAILADIFRSKDQKNISK